MRELFVRALGLVCAIAFASLLVQLAGLIGPEGVAPATEFVAALHRARLQGFLAAPTLFWFGASLGALRTAAALGIITGLLVAAGLIPRAGLIVLWALYLSFLGVGDVFLGYQWDALLVETCALGAFYAPGGGRLRDLRPSPSGRILLRLLLFKLMFLSGVVKLASGDPNWRNFTALTYHFWTQPLPNPLSLAVAASPHWLLVGLCVISLALELVVPFCIFGPRPLRRFAFVAFASLQIGIELTGNYGFFNLLTLVLCLPLLDDAKAEPPEPAPRRALAGVLAVAVLLPALGNFTLFGGALLPLLRAEAVTGTFHSYGLFAVMTTTRDELSIEGSDDGRAWQPYGFFEKPEVDRPMPIVAPHQPRLDWQMWFAALSTCQDNPWLLRLSQRLLENSPPVRSLFREAPFAAHPPRYLRITARAFIPKGLGWQAGPARLYCPVLTLVGGRLAAIGNEPAP